MNQLKELFDNNREWAAAIVKEQPDFFEQLSQQQAPEYLWIGCSDSRVPANEILGMMPGEIFVHRNVANLVVHTDLNCLSVIQFAVEVLKIKHIIVCGHYGCGGVKAAVNNEKHGLIDNWLLHIQDAQEKHHDFLSELQDKEKLQKYMCELNVIEQVLNVCKTNSVRESWLNGQSLSVHGWIYGLRDGLLRNLSDSFSSQNEIKPHYQAAVEGIKKRVIASAAKNDSDEP
jgi:carbonic anhydrase